MAKSSIPFGRIKRPPKAWLSAEVESAIGERRKAFAATHRSDEDRPASISASRRASSVIAKAKAEAWQTTCSSLSPKYNPKSVHSLLGSIAGSPSSFSFSPNFLNCSSPREAASVYAAYLRSHFSVSQLKALRSRTRGYLTELRRATCPEESRSSFCSPFSPAELLAAASNLSSSTATGPDKVAYPMLKHLPRSGMDFHLRILNLSWSSHSFPFINLSFLTGALVWFFKITKVVPFESVEVFRKNPFLALYFSLSSLMIFWPLCFLPSAALFTLTIWPFGPPPPRSSQLWRPHKKLCFDWSTDLSTGVFLSIRANVRPPSSQWIPTKLTSSPTFSYSTPASVSIPLQLFLEVTFDRTLSFSKHVSSLKAKFFPRLKALRGPI